MFLKDSDPNALILAQKREQIKEEIEVLKKKVFYN
jgi:hypothetical protein